MAILEDKKRVDVTDVSKLRPELLELPDTEFERRWSEMEMAKAERDRIKNEKEEEAKKAINNAIKARFAVCCVEMHDAGIMPSWVNIEAVTDKKGNVNFFRALRVARPQD
jgi:hypothetical protein